MLQLSEPIWLYALTAMALPVMIHLWNDRKGKLLSIGSVLFLDRQSRRQSRSPRISEWLLLILRCLLVLALALLLAGPGWKKTAGSAAVKGWILVGDTTRESVGIRQRIDSLIHAGYIRKAMQADTAGDATVNWWASFSRLDRMAPAHLPFYVFTDGRAIHFRGQRPVTARTVAWWLGEDSADRVETRVVRAWKEGRARDSIIMLSRESRATGSLYHYGALPVSAETGGRVQGVIVDTTPLTVSIQADENYNQDGRYVAAALRALQQFTRRNIRISISGTTMRPEIQTGKTNWVFWLSGRPLPAGLQADNVLCYQSGREIPVDSRLTDIDIPLSRMVADTGAVDGAPIWKDGFGQVMLLAEQRPGSRIYHFNSHFDPAWNGLVWSARFPAILSELLIQDPAAQSGDTLRVLDPGQVQPAKGSITPAPGLPSAGEDAYTVDLAPLCWVLIFILFLTERILSYRIVQSRKDV